ncbi:Uncharacterised protein [Bordetella pertussis]|nr:Uncharacterised protein [Bordetella pertussis]CFP59039.1 Uncharacterised protein [Bordetella pertussis]
MIESGWGSESPSMHSRNSASLSCAAVFRPMALPSLRLWCTTSRRGYCSASSLSSAPVLSRLPSLTAMMR